MEIIDYFLQKLPTIPLSLSVLMILSEMYYPASFPQLTRLGHVI